MVRSWPASSASRLSLSDGHPQRRQAGQERNDGRVGGTSEAGAPCADGNAVSGAGRSFPPLALVVAQISSRRAVPSLQPDNAVTAGLAAQDCEGVVEEVVG